MFWTALRSRDPLLAVHPHCSPGPVPGGECPQGRGSPQSRAQSGRASWVQQRGAGQRRVEEEAGVGHCDVTGARMAAAPWAAGKCTFPGQVPLSGWDGEGREGRGD